MMSVVKDKERKERKKTIRNWLIYSTIYAIFYGILYGTFSYYFGNIPFIFGLRMDVPWVFIILGLAGWTLLTFIIFKGKSFSLGG